MTNQTPIQYDFEVGLLTLSILRVLIRRQFGHTMSLPSVSRVMSLLSITRSNVTIISEKLVNHQNKLKKNMTKKILILILNWNGWEDTISCCESLSKDDNTDFEVLIFDNGSTNDSVKKIKDYLNESNATESKENFSLYNQLVEVNIFNHKNRIFRLISFSENLGFARGCNASAEYAKAHSFDEIMLLNNDTIVESGAIKILHECLNSENVDLVIPQIRYFSKPNKIWNCGGEVSRLGKVKYYYANSSCELLKNEKFRIGFATGCCILTKTKTFTELNGFTEKFFFGEEDVELSFRLKKSNKIALCNTAAIIYHKVGASIKGSQEVILRKSFIHYLNRIINMRSQMPNVIWQIWRSALLAKAASRVIILHKLSFSRTINFVKSLRHSSSQLQGVSKEYFENVMRNGIPK
ncbi:glycosyltransferase [Malikia spinosa]|uniref:glycosyltransferase n=1 Tax=Malikia spinosa TaxID=86180 RepID=UPI0027B90073|nr:glycosyltransferase [Malikia spinosa]